VIGHGVYSKILTKFYEVLHLFTAHIATLQYALQCSELQLLVHRSTEGRVATDRVVCGGLWVGFVNGRRNGDCCG
jgi:hypothetical protein